MSFITYDAIISLGGGVYPTKNPSLLSLTFLSRDRLIRAQHLFLDGAAPKIIVTGGLKSAFGEHARISETPQAQLATQFLTNRGISPGAITKLEDGRDTITEMFAICRFIKASGNINNLLFVTHQFHETRVRWLAKRILGDTINVSIEALPAELRSRKSGVIRYFISPQAEMEYLDALKSHFARKFGSSPIPDFSTEQWFRENPELYSMFKEIKVKYTRENDLVNVAYRGVERSG